MAATTVRLDQETKRELDRLQGLVQSETGERITHGELLRRLVSVGRRHEGELMAKEGVSWLPPSREQLGRLLEGVKDWEVQTDASEVDDVLYGGSPHG